MAETPMFRAEPSDLAVHSPEQLIAAIDQMQQRITELEQSLERQERLATLGTIAGLIAHEFNNILTPVLSYAQMAMAAPQDHELSQKAHSKAAEGADRAGQIAGAILGLVRRDHGNVPRGTLQRCEVGEALERALACLARPLEKDMIEYQTELSQDAAAIAARGVAVEHVLLNLVINARSAMLPRGGELRVSSARNLPRLSAAAVVSWSGGAEAGWPLQVSERENVVVEVTDSGRGMSAERMSRLFDLSGITGNTTVTTVTTNTYSTNIPASGDRRGHGLGMLVCKRLVEDAGGVMVVESEVGRGTRVWVVWPAAVGE
jgi:signal transduction histidine kinase